MGSLEDSNKKNPKRRPPATTPEGRENELIVLAQAQAELMLREGKAPAPVVVHYLKLATEEHKLEVEKTQQEIAFLRKKTDMVDHAERISERIDEAMKQMTIYKGEGDPEDYEQYDY